jgi:LacI family transcriptional regulator
LTSEPLLEHGHDRPAVITPPVEWSNVAEVCDGFAQTYAELGLELDPRLVHQVNDFESESGLLGVDRLLGSRALPTAIFAAGDGLAIGALQSLRRKMLTVP